MKLKRCIMGIIVAAVFLCSTMTSVIGAIETDVVDITKNSARVKWHSNRDDVDDYTLSIDGSIPVSIEKGKEILVTGGSGSTHQVEIIGTRTVLGKVYKMSLSAGISAVYNEMVLDGDKWVPVGEPIPVDDMEDTLVRYVEAGDGFYTEAVTKTVIMEKITIDVIFLNTVNVFAISNNESLGSVAPELSEVLLGESVELVARPLENGLFEKWVEVTDVGYEKIDIGYTEKVVITPKNDIYLKAVFTSKDGSTVGQDPTDPNNPGGTPGSGSDSNGGDPDGSDPTNPNNPGGVPGSGSDPNGSDPDGSDPTDPNNPGGTPGSGSDPSGSDPDRSDPTNPNNPGGTPGGGSNPEGSDPEGSDPEGSDPEGSDPDGSDPDGSDPSDDDPSDDVATIDPDDIPEGLPGSQNPDGGPDGDSSPDGSNPDGSDPDGRDPDGSDPTDTNNPDGTPSSDGTPGSDDTPDDGDPSDDVATIDPDDIPEGSPGSQNPDGTPDDDPSKGDDSSSGGDPDDEDEDEPIEDEPTPQGIFNMPRTGGIFIGFFILLSIALIGTGVYLRVKNREQ